MKQEKLCKLKETQYELKETQYKQYNMPNHKGRTHHYRRILSLLLCAGMMMGLLSGCGVKKNQSKSWVEPLDTLTNLTVYATEDDGAQLISDIDAALTRYDRLFDIYNEYEGLNNLKTVNEQAGIAPVQVDSELIELLQFSKEMYTLTDGAMNIAMGSVLSIWHDYRTWGMENPEEAALPPMEALEAAAKHTNIDDIVIDEAAQTVYLADADMSLDVGAVAKGFVADKIEAMIKAANVEHALLDMSSAIIATGSKSNGQAWRLALQNPDTDSEDSVLHVIDLKNNVLVTSGDYQRYYEVDGKRYHHIIDRNTLMPADTFSSVSVIGNEAALADALSTALFCMSLDEGMALVESLENVEALWITTDGEETMTDGFAAYMER